MNLDIRLSLDFFRHPKTKKTLRKIGWEGVCRLQMLWIWAAEAHPTGILTGVDKDDIELAVDWQGDEGAFVDTLLELGWLISKDGVYCLHNWEERQAYVCKSEQRHEAARKAINARWDKHRKKKEADTVSIPYPYPTDTVSQENDTSRIRTVYEPYTDGIRTEIPQNTNTPIHQNTKTPSLSPESSINTPRAREGGDGQEGERDFSFQEKVSERSAHPDRNNAKSVPDRITYRNSEGKGEAVLIGAALAGTFGKMADRQAAPEPPIEFIDLRDWYTRNCRPEGPLAGFRAYQSLIATRQWPGITRINDDLSERLRQGHYQAGYWPSLERYLSERTWESPIRPRPQNDDDRPLIRPWKSSRFPEEVTA